MSYACFHTAGPTSDATTRATETQRRAAAHGRSVKGSFGHEETFVLGDLRVGFYRKGVPVNDRSRLKQSFGRVCGSRLKTDVSHSRSMSPLAQEAKAEAACCSSKTIGRSRERPLSQTTTKRDA